MLGTDGGLLLWHVILIVGVVSVLYIVIVVVVVELNKKALKTEEIGAKRKRASQHIGRLLMGGRASFFFAPFPAPVQWAPD